MHYLCLLDKQGNVHFKNIAVTAFILESRYSHVPLLLELTGVQTLVRACWANLVKHRKGQRDQETNLRLVLSAGREIRLHARPSNKTKRYISQIIPGSAPKEYKLRIVSTALSAENAEYVFGIRNDDEAMSPWFASALAKVPLVPYLNDWLPQMWDAGKASNLVTKVPGHLNTTAFPLWKVSNSDALWQKVVKNLVISDKVQSNV